MHGLVVPKKGQAVGAYSFKQVGEKILAKLVQKVGSAAPYDLEGSYAVDDLPFQLENSSSLEKLLAMVVFHRILYHPYGISGDVKSYRISAPVREAGN